MLFDFLRGLNEQYAHVRSQIMLMRPFPNINTAFYLLTRQERQMHSKEFDSRTLMNVTDQGSYGRGQTKRHEGANRQTLVAEMEMVEDNPQGSVPIVRRLVTRLRHATKSMDFLPT